MTMFALLDGGAVSIYPLTLRELRRLSKTSPRPSDEDLAEYDVVVVQPTEKPAATVLQKVVELDPVDVGGVWQQAWSVVDLDAGEITERRAAMLGRLDFEITVKEPKLSAAELVAQSEIGATDTPLIDAIVANSSFSEAQVTNNLTARRNAWRALAGEWLAVSFTARQLALSGNLADIRDAIVMVRAL